MSDDQETVNIIFKSGTKQTLKGIGIFEKLQQPDDNLIARWDDGEIQMDCVAGFVRLR